MVGRVRGGEDDAVGLTDIDDEMDFLPECNAFEPQELADAARRAAGRCVLLNSQG